MKVFQSRVDTWLVAIIVGAELFCLWMCTQLFAAGAYPAALGLLLFGVGLPLWMLLSTRYVVDDDTLAVRCGPFRWRVPLGSIEAVRETHNPVSSPALSLDRLEISYMNGKSVIVSPADKRGFCAAIHCPVA
ncbi:hypothetical protein E4634_10805 [Mangrovimicrobium sediminis]|uniref:Uncharacterized protein YyaB-like PH domain-containing protein n=1 Tax=Mangrovimicrobium sediminis TaxID=2562682 RepID=A0A4Z0M1U6_9GAMM|nr:PH domain-containing protein [Haliea sp. SAOS-164]TGD73511.1 hypothetical protein E4634_10805 [Haliea sp. SAOS-164]